MINTLYAVRIFPVSIHNRVIGPASLQEVPYFAGLECLYSVQLNNRPKSQGYSPCFTGFEVFLRVWMPKTEAYASCTTKLSGMRRMVPEPPK